ncbi:ABC transporter permease [Tabrizicola sp.]|uniref:ABC transporter permease n=1 Tax=Tabrizicola sp. TaxID=2005166 RepID=UPI002622ACE4|nr:ABC transporter permease [Tabrizicola sp.]MDM7932216.1 ABC transporter permease [Tabrizicola sp.]
MKLISTSELLSLQVRVIVSLILRETRATFGTSTFGYVWAVITPTVSVALLVFLFSMVGRHPPFGSSLALFFATGILVLQLFNELSNKLMTVFDANRALLTYPIIKDVDTLLARAILISTTYVMIMVTFFGGLWLLGLAAPPARPDQVVIAFLAASLLGIGFGTLNAVVASMWETWTQVEKVLTRPLFFISGIFYVPSQLPPQAREFLQWNPVLHLIEWFRWAYYPNYGTTLLNVWYPVGLGAGMLCIGLLGERVFRSARF